MSNHDVEIGGLTAAERSVLHDAFEEFRRGRFTTASTMYAAVERIVTEREAVAVNNGVRLAAQLVRDHVMDAGTGMASAVHDFLIARAERVIPSVEGQQ